MDLSKAFHCITHDLLITNLINLVGKQLRFLLIQKKTIKNENIQYSKL